jgi:hypothetical protein
MTWNWHFDTQIILEFLKRGYRIREVPIPTYYGDEICRVNGIPYAANCVREALKYALTWRWRAGRTLRQDETQCNRGDAETPTQPQSSASNLGSG